jgi:SSS family solute:Na+ symporter
MFGLPWADIAVIAAYFGIVLVIGAWASRRVRGEEDFFLAGRRFGKVIQTFAAFGQGTSADNAVGVSTTTFSNGASGIWSSMLYLFGTPVYWFTAAWMRRLRMLTFGDFFAERYGSRKMAAVYALIGTMGMMAFIALGFNAMAKTILAITPKPAAEFSEAEVREYQVAFDRRAGDGGAAPGERVLSLEELREKESLEGIVNLEVLIWLVCVVVLLYASAGGLEAAFLTDLLQGVGIIVLSIILIPFAWARINAVYGGEKFLDALGTIHARLPNSHFDLFGSPLAIDFTWYYIIALSVMAMLTVSIQPNQLVAAGSANTRWRSTGGQATAAPRLASGFFPSRN